ncbi:MAG: FliH/SctL family protein [Lachnospiraceae bacterium]|nr:FliH/SctL family protein [Lachnospiraceae bacterium]
MSNILYRMQIQPQEEVQTCIINSNDVLDERIEEHQKMQLERARLKQLEEGDGSPAEMDDGQLEQGDFTGLDEVIPQEIQPEEPEVDYVAEAQAEAESILNEARMQADEILVQAESQAEAIKSHAQAEGQKEGYDQGILEAAAAQAQWEAETEALRQNLQQEYLQKQSTIEKELVQVVCDVVEKVFLIQFGDKREIILHLLDNTLSNIEGGKEFLIRVNEANCEFLRGHKSQLQDKVGQEILLDIVQDPLLDDTQCMIETDGGLFDCGMDTQMRNLIKDIKSLS